MKPLRQQIREHIVEIVSDSGEGAQKSGQIFGVVSARMGNGVWTVEIIPAEIKPPARSRAGASGIRIRFGTDNITNMGDFADIVVAFNEQVLYGRIAQAAYCEGTVVLLENRWADDPAEEIRKQYADTLAELKRQKLRVMEVPLEEECKKHTKHPRLGKNMFVLGVLCQLYDRDTEIAKGEISKVFRHKNARILEVNHTLFDAGYEWAKALDLAWSIPLKKDDTPRVVMNGNQAVGLGVMASGMEMVAMYPITPATSASHYLAEAFHKVGGVVHQAEDEIAAAGFAIGSSYAGRTACTITSGPGLALKTELLGLAIMAEVPLVLVLVQRGGPSTGLPTKVEQGDLLASLYGEPGDAPKIVMAAATIAECFHMVIMARQLAEDFRTLAMVLTDTNLATGVQPFPRPIPQASWMAAPIDQSPWQEGTRPYEWDHETGLSPRPIPGQKGGEYVLTGLAHTEQSHVAYEPSANQLGCEMRSRKLAALQSTLKPPEVYGDDSGELLVVGWGSTLGAINEAVDRARAEGLSVSAVHVRFLSPLEPGLPEIFKRFKRVMTVELNYSDPERGAAINPGYRRTGQLAWLLRAETLMDIGCWSVVHGQPLRPGLIYEQLVERLSQNKPAAGEVA